MGSGCTASRTQTATQAVEKSIVQKPEHAPEATPPPESSISPSAHHLIRRS